MTTQTLPTMEGLTPTILWITLFGLICFGSLIVLADKVAEVFRKHRKRQADKEAAQDTSIQEQLLEINSKLSGIDGFIQESDRRFDRDNRRLFELESKYEDINHGIKALCRSSLAHLNHDITGNHVDTLKDALNEINEYLTER